MRTAFTLIELIIVISVIVVFSSISIPLYQRYTVRSLFASAKVQVAVAAKRAILDLSSRGSCLPSVATGATYSVNTADDSSSALASYTIMNVGVIYDGCMVLGFFRAADKGGHPKLAGKVVRIHYTRNAGEVGLLNNAQCFSSVSGTELGLADGEEGCVYGQAWADKP